MDLYHLVLFAHIIGAVVVVGSSFVSPLLMGGIRRAATVDRYRDWVEVMQKIARVTGMSAGVVLLSGLYMGVTAHSFTQGWLAVSLVLFIVNGILAGGLLSKHLDLMAEAAGDAPDGPVPAEAAQLAGSQRAHTIEGIAFGNDLAIVFLMTNKPGWTAALLVAAAGLAIGGAIIARAARSHRPTPAVAA